MTEDCWDSDTEGRVTYTSNTHLCHCLQDTHASSHYTIYTFVYIYFIYFILISIFILLSISVFEHVWSHLTAYNLKRTLVNLIETYKYFNVQSMYNCSL